MFHRLSHTKNLPPPFSLPEKKRKERDKKISPSIGREKEGYFFCGDFFPHICSAVQFAFWAAEMGKKECFSEYPVIICRYSWTKKRGIKGERPFIDALSLAVSVRERGREGLKSYANVSLPSLHYCCKTFLGLGGGIVPTSYFPLFPLSLPAQQTLLLSEKNAKTFFAGKKSATMTTAAFPLRAAKKIEVKRNSEIFSSFFLVIQKVVPIPTPILENESFYPLFPFPPLEVKIFLDLAVSLSYGGEAAAYRRNSRNSTR